MKQHVLSDEEEGFEEEEEEEEAPVRNKFGVHRRPVSMGNRGNFQQRKVSPISMNAASAAARNWQQ